jgi:cytochrome P450
VAGAVGPPTHTAAASTCRNSRIVSAVIGSTAHRRYVTTATWPPSMPRATISVIEVVAFNPFEPGFVENPYPALALLREHDPVHQTPFEVWYVSRYEDVLRLLRDPALSVDETKAGANVLTSFREEVLGDDREVRHNLSMLDRDPPDHTRLRRLVSRAFTPRRIADLRPRIQELVDARLDDAADAGGMELIGDLAFPLPFDVISELLGLPDTDRDQIRQWSGVIVRSLEPVTDPELVRAIEEAGANLSALITDIISWKRANPDDRILSRLIEAEDDGDVLSDDELVAQVLLLFVAGHETTVNLIGNGTLALLRNPSQLDALRSDPGLITNAVEELLRYDSPVQMSRRITLSDLEIGGRTIDAGSFVIAGLAAANRDEAHFGPDAGELDFRRQNAGDHLAFGGGVHFCLGAALARMEAQVAIGSLVQRFPRIAAAGDPVWNGRINLRGLDAFSLAVA